MGLIERLRGSGVGAVLARGATGALAINIGSAAAAFAAYMVTSNILGASRFGDYVFVLGWVNIAALFTTLGLDTGAVRFIPAHLGRDEPAYVRGFIRWSLGVVTGIAALVAVAGAGVLLALGSLRPALRLTFFVGCALLVGLTVLRLLATQVQAFKRIVRAHGPLYLGRPLLTGIGVLVIFGATDDVTAPQAMAINAAATIALIALTYTFLRQVTPPEVRSADVQTDGGQWLRTSLSFLFYSGFLWIMGHVDLLMLGMIDETRSSGLYGPASQLSTLVSYGLTAVNVIAAPLIAELHARGDERRLRRILRLAAAGAFMLAAIAATGLIVLGRWLLGLFGPEFSVGYDALVALTLGMVTYALGGLATTVMNMTGHERQAAWLAAAALVLNVALNAVMIPPYGLIGAAIATAVSTAITHTLFVVYALRRIGLNPTLFPLGRFVRPR